MSAEEDRKYMKRALELARRGGVRTRPNPLVGAVIVKAGRVIGEGWHEQFGGPHAEVNAFRRCTEDPAGAVLYVTLEPCSHYGKTPPCADLIIRKDIRRVVAAAQDPNPLVSGRGFHKLRNAGIEVTIGVLEEECRRLNEIFFTYVTEKRPFVLYKAAVSLDGKTACHTGASQWISCKESRREVQVLRGRYKGIMAGSGTILADDPRLTARIPGVPDPVRIIADSRLLVPLDSVIFREPGENIILTTSTADKGKKERLQEMGIRIVETDGPGGRVDLRRAMTFLAAQGIDSILLEGGATLAAAAFEAGIIDKVRLYMAPLIIGGVTAPGPVGGTGAASLPEAVRLKAFSWELSGTDLAVTSYVERGNFDVYRDH